MWLPLGSHSDCPVRFMLPNSADGWSRKGLLSLVYFNLHVERCSLWIYFIQCSWLNWTKSGRESTQSERQTPIHLWAWIKKKKAAFDFKPFSMVLAMRKFNLHISKDSKMFLCELPFINGVDACPSIRTLTVQWMLWMVFYFCSMHNSKTNVHLFFFPRSWMFSAILKRTKMFANSLWIYETKFLRLECILFS